MTENDRGALNSPYQSVAGRGKKSSDIWIFRDRLGSFPSVRPLQAPVTNGFRTADAVPVVRQQDSRLHFLLYFAQISGGNKL